MKIAIVLGAMAILVWAADQATLDRGQKEAGQACTPCHSLRLVQSQRLSRATWGKEIDKMTGWGAKIQDRDALLEYLAANFGDGKPANPPAMTKNGVPPNRKQN
jgi:cytochrome c1